jgi:long-subunit fatty acid transport protein
MYLSDTQRFTTGGNLSFGLGQGWSVGVGGQFYLVGASTAKIRLPSGGNSTGRMKMDIRPGFAPTLGVVKKLEDSPWSIAAAYWSKVDNKVQIDANNDINLINTTTPLNLTAKTSLAFDPETFILATSYQNDIMSLSASVHYERWSANSGSAIGLTFQTLTNSFSQTVPNATFSDIISSHLGFERKWSSFTGRLGYAFVPTPVPDQSGESNFLDTDKHMAGLGLGWPKLLKNILGENTQLDFAVLVHYLKPKTVVKNLPTSIGYPGYKIGGWAWSYGLSLTTEL